MIQNQNIMFIEEPDYDKLLEKQDFFPKIFLIPSQIKLHRDEGLKVLKRNENFPDKFQQQKVLPIKINQEQIKAYKQAQIGDKKQHPAGHGLLSLFKKTSTRRIKLAICICVYSQPKSMLKSTIKGIQQSYKYFLQKAGILPHQIILTVIFDGIEKVNNSKDQTQNMISYFNEMDIKNGFVHKPYGKSLDQYLKQIQQKNYPLNGLQIDKVDDISLFTQEQLSKLRSKLFQNQYNQYIRIKKLLKQIQILKKKKDLNIELLPSDITKKYQELCQNFCISNNLYYQTLQQIYQYLSTKKNIRVKLIYQAIYDIQVLCRRYLQSRHDSSILYPVRVDTDDLKNPRQNVHDDSDIDLSQQLMKKQYNYMFFVVKHKNEGKLSSHMLFFQGFCKLFDPQYCILSDVGIKPHKDAIYKMWAHMQKKPKCGGVCGYMGLQLQNPYDQLGYRDDGYDQDQVDCLTRFTNNFFTIQRAQQFQYHFSHMLDKPFQAAFGYIHVLPGAFSGYRWKALKSMPYDSNQYPQKTQDFDQMETDRDFSLISDDQDENTQTLMKRYLKTAVGDQSAISLEDSNMYLAEDRIMCLGIHSLGYDLDYLPDAESTVDPVTSLTKLMGQRRRWINGSWFAFNYVRSHSYERSNYKFLIQLLYYSLVQKITWIAPAIFYVSMNLTLIAAVREYVLPLFQQFFNSEHDYELYNYRISIFSVKNVVQSIPAIINFIFILVLFSVILYSVLVNHNQSKFKKVYYLASSLMGIYGFIVMVLLFANTYAILFDICYGQEKHQFIIPLIYLRCLILFIIIGHTIPILWTFSFKKYIQIITSVFSYLFFTPTYINILMVFAFCRIDDLSWGTKGLDSDGSISVSRQWQRRKYIFVLQFITTNVLVSYILVRFSDFDYPRNVIILSTTILVVFLLLFRLIPGFIYLIKYYIIKYCGKKFKSKYINNNLNNGNRILRALKVIQLKIKEIQKQEVKIKKKKQYNQVSSSQVLTKSLSNFGFKLRKKVAHHMLNNNLFPKKQLLNPKKKQKRKKITLKKKLKTVEQVSNQQSQESQAKIKYNRSKDKENQKDIDYQLIIPSTKKKHFRERVKELKHRKNNRQ